VKAKDAEPVSVTSDFNGIRPNLAPPGGDGMRFLQAGQSNGRSWSSRSRDTVSPKRRSAAERFLDPIPQ
jgi:hypothetical protein